MAVQHDSTPQGLGCPSTDGFSQNQRKQVLISKQREEAERVVKLCNLYPRFKVHTGANGEFEGIKDQVNQATFDGAEAVNLIIQRAHATDARRLVLLPVGKLTTIALALKKDPTIVPKVRIVWLGSNYPEPGEYDDALSTGRLNIPHIPQ